MKIFITGTTGFLGRSLREHFEVNYEIIEYQRGTDVFMALEANQPNMIIHCAGEIYCADLMYDTNVRLTHDILEWVRANPLTRMITIGSSSEYGPVPRATTEQDPIRPQNLYEATKGAATLLCQGYSRQYDLDILVARIYSGYGAYEREHRLFPRLYRAFFNNEPMTLYAGVHDFIYIEDFVRGIDQLLHRDWPAGEIVNFGSGVQTSNYAVLEAWQRVTDRTGAVAYIDQKNKAHDTDIWLCDTTYAREQYGFSTEYTLEQGIADFIRKMT